MSTDDLVAAGAGAPVRADLRLAGPAGAAWLTCAVLLGATPRVALTVTGMLGAAGAAALAVRRFSTAAVAAVLLCASAAAAVAGFRLAALAAGPVPRLAAAGASASVELVVTGDPELHAARVRGSGRSRDLVVMRARAERVVVRSIGVRVRTPVVVLATGPGWTALLPTSRVVASGRLAPPRRGDLVAAVLLARGPPRLLHEPSTPQRVAGRIRAGLRSASTVLPADVEGLLPGLVIGDTSRLDPALRQDFRTTGMTHLVAVSGDNVGSTV